MDKVQLLLKRIKEDRPFYMEKFLKIRNKEAKLIPFKINDAQELFEAEIRRCEKEGILKRFIVLKARQMGFSTFTEGYIFHDTTTNTFKNSMIIAHEDKATQNLFNMSKLYYEELPVAIKPMIKYSNGKELVFENPTGDPLEKKNNPGLRSKITVATAGTVEVGRSATVHNLHASEVAFFPDATTTMLGLLQCVPDTLNSCVILESTANGVGGYFYDMWQKAVRGENDFIPLFYPWFTDKSYTRNFQSENEKEYFLSTLNDYEKSLMENNNLTPEQMNWRKYTIANKCQGDVELFMQEYPSTPEEAFIASGRPVFNTASKRKYMNHTQSGICGYLKEDGKDVKFLEDEKGYVEIWQPPKVGEFYVIGADVAEGKIEGDYSVAQVLDSDCNVVAMWYGHIDPDLFGYELVKLARFYNDAYLGVEANNHGLTTLKAVQRYDYWNLYFAKIYDRFTDSITKKLGWQTTSKTKPMAIDKLAEFVRDFHIGIKSKITVQELLTYIIEENGSTNAQQGCHDDCVMSLAIALQVWLEGKGDNFTPEVVDENKSSKNIVDPLFEGEEDEVCE